MTGREAQALRQAALREARAIARNRGVAMTDLRSRVLELLLLAERPTGAYALLESLAQGRQAKGGVVAPTTVYRALDFLVGQGFAHRIASQNAFVACWHFDHPHSCQFLICTACGKTLELEDPALAAMLDASSAAHGFLASRQIVEIHGRCGRCVAAGAML